jgi:hypothetical protein
MGTSLRDIAAQVHGASAIRITKVEQGNLMARRRQQTLGRVKAIAGLNAPKGERFDLICEALEDHDRDMRAILRMQTSD